VDPFGPKWRSATYLGHVVLSGISGVLDSGEMTSHSRTTREFFVMYNSNDIVPKTYDERQPVFL